MSSSESQEVLPIGSRIKSFRAQDDISLETLAEMSGVSRSLLWQIEAGRANPTLATVWRISQALGVDIQDLVASGDPSPDSVVVTLEETPVLISDGGRYQARCLGPVELGGIVEWYDLRAKAGMEMTCTPHERGTVEHLTVLKGCLQIQTGDKVIDVKEGETARYTGDKMHIVRNTTKKPAHGVIVTIMEKNMVRHGRRTRVGRSSSGV